MKHHVRRSAHINVMIDAAEKAGRALIRDFGEVEQLQVSRKGPGDFVSKADLNAERIIRDTLQKARPKYGFLMEESGATAGEDASCRFIVDPLDGTSNFLHGIPHWSVSIALEKDGELLCGVVYNPILDEMFWAEKGLGAYMNNRRLQVSARNALSDSLIGAYLDPKDAATMTQLSEKTGMRMRTLGSMCLDLCYVAAGRFDGFVHGFGSKAWDLAAGAVIVREARGIVTDTYNKLDIENFGTIIAGNSALHNSLMDVFRPEIKKSAP